jgi:hypothetical protein
MRIQAWTEVAVSSPSSPADPDPDLLVHAAGLLRQGDPRVDITLREPLAELLADAAAGDDHGVLNPLAVDVARVLVGEQPDVPSVSGSDPEATG